MKKKFIIFLICGVFVFSTPVFAAETPTQPTIPTEQTEESVSEYNKQVDEYNAQVDEYNKSIDEQYEKDLQEYNNAVEFNQKQDKLAKQAIEHNKQEDEKVEENKKQLEEQEKLDKQVENFEQKGITENRLTKEQITEENLPTSYAPTTTVENAKTIKVTTPAEEKSGEKYYITNVHIYYKESDSEKISIGASITDETFKLNRDIAEILLLEWESIEVDKNDEVMVYSESEAMGYKSAAFYRKMEGYTNGYWTPSLSEFASTANFVYNSWYKGSATVFSYIDGTTDGKSIKNILNIMEYSFVRLSVEPERVEVYIPKYMKIDDTRIEAIVPIKGEYLNKLNYLIYTPKEVVPVEVAIDSEEPENAAGPVKVTIEPASPDEPVVSSVQSNIPVRRILRRTAAVSNNSTLVTTNSIINTPDTPTTIEENQTPTTLPVVKKQNPQYWALLNLILTILSLILSIVLFIYCLRKKLKEKKEQKDGTYIEEESSLSTKRKYIRMGISVVITILMIFFFFATEDMSLKMQFTDKYTLIMFVYIIIQILFVAFLSMNKKRREEINQDEN